MRPTIMTCFIWLIVLLLPISLVGNCVGLESTVDRTYVFGVNLALNATSAESMQYLNDQKYSLIGYEIWRDWWNALPAQERTTSWGEVVSVELNVETFSNYEYGDWQLQELFNVYDTMINNTSGVDFLFGTTDWSGYYLRNFTYYERHVPIFISPGDSSENYTSIPGSFGSPTASTQIFASWLPYLRVAKAESIAILSIWDDIYQNQMCEGAAQQAPLNGLEVLYYDTHMPFNWSPGVVASDPASIAVWTSTLDAVRLLNPDAVAICDYSFAPEFVLQYMKDHDWTPKTVALSPGSQSALDVFKDPSLLDFVILTSPYQRDAKYVRQPNFVDCAGYNDLILQKYGLNANGVMAQATLAGMLYSNMLVTAASPSTQDLVHALQLSQIASFMGTSAFDAHQRQVMPSMIIQRLEGGAKMNVIGPAQAAVESMIYPMPTWKERNFGTKWGSGVDIASLVIASLGMVSSISWLIFLLRYWRNPIIVASSPIFCLVVILGSMLVYGSIFTWTPSLASDATCQLRAWLLPLGFFAMFGALLAKTYRVVALFNAPGLDLIMISNLEVAIGVGVILLGQIILSVFSITLTRLMSKVVIVDPYRLSENYYACTFTSAMKAIAGLNIAYGGILFLVGIYLAVKVRKVSISRYDESKIIGFSIYNTGIFALISIAVQLSLGNDKRDVSFMIMTICCFLGATITTGMLMGSKMKTMFCPSNGKPKTTSTSSGNGRSKTATASKMNQYDSSSGNDATHARSGSLGSGATKASFVATEMDDVGQVSLGKTSVHEVEDISERLKALNKALRRARKENADLKKQMIELQMRASDQ